MQRKSFCFAIRDDGGDDIIRDHQLNHAWNGDRVLVPVTREEDGVDHQKWSAVHPRASRPFAACRWSVRTNAWWQLDDRMLTTIELGRHLNTCLGTVPPRWWRSRLTAIPLYPAGPCCAASLCGPAADRDLLLTKAGLHERPTAPRGSAKAPASKGRTDLTDQPALLLCSWQSADAPPLPAVHVEAKDGGSCLWVHAPSIAERFGQGSSLDLWMRERGEALCLGDAWQPLLTAALTKACRSRLVNPSDLVRLVVSPRANSIGSSYSAIRPVASVDGQQLQPAEQTQVRSFR